MKIKDKDIGEILGELRRLWPLAKKYKWQIAVYTLMAFLSTVFGLLTSLVSQTLIDLVTKSTSGQSILKFGSIYSAVGAAVAFAVFGIVFAALNSRISERIRLKVNTEMTASLFDKFVCSRWEHTSHYASGDVLNRFNSDISAVASGVIGTAPTFIAKLFQFGAAFSVIFYYDKIMALIALISIPLTLFFSRTLVTKMHSYAKRLKKINSRMMAFNSDALQNMQYLKSFGLVGLFSSRLRDLQGEYVDLSLEYNKFSIVTTSVISLISQFTSYGCLGWGIYRLWGGAISFGTLVLFVQLYSVLSSSFSALVSIIPTMVNVTAASARIGELENLPKDDSLYTPETTEFFNEAKNDKIAVSFKDVSFTYNGEHDQALKTVSFFAETGDFVALTGPSGEGKTTMLRLLLALVSPEGGDIEIFRLSDEKKVPVSPATRRFFSYVPQKNTMFGDTLAANMRLVCPEATDEDIIAALKNACAYDFVSKEKEGIYCHVGDGGVGFSEGQLQRLSIARALLRDAPIVLFDEATSALDVDTEQQVLMNLAKWGKDKICIFTTHRTSVFEVCNRAYIVTERDCMPVL